MSNPFESKSQKCYHQGVSNNNNRIARHIATWIRNEEMCHHDFETHNFLSSDSPQTAEERYQLHHRLSEEDDGTSMDPGEPADVSDAV
eukprot:6849606-Karenia_brevis.AAC.1